jgi:hypothetical protein
MASRTSEGWISTGQAGSSGDQSTRPEATAGSIAALGDSISALAQLGQGDAEVEDRERLENDPGLRRQHSEVVTDGGGQRPGQREPSRSPGIEVEPVAQHCAQVQRVPARAICQV